MNLELEPEGVGALKARRGFRLWVFQIPLLRLAGFLLLSLAVGLHNRFILNEEGLSDALTFGAVSLGYSLVSWAITAALFPRYRAVGQLFLALDLAPFTLALALTGGPASWLYPVLILRAADQVGAGVRRTLVLGLLAAGCYGLMLALWPDQPLAAGAYGRWALIVFANLYLALTARTVSGLRERTRAAVRVARQAVQDLERHLEEREKLEEERIRTQKLESLGHLAGGLAHDFNNLLTAVLGNVSLLKVRAPRDPAAREQLEELERACLRARDLTRQLLTFARGGAPIRTVFAAWPVIRDTAVFALRGSTSRCELDAAADLWRLEADEAQVAQVVQNLVLNAAQAMPRGGTVHVAVRNADPFEAAEAGLDPERLWMRLSVSDQGSGIDRDLLERIFDPYFTTKPEGSGLGLTTSNSIITRHGGALRVESRPGVGTTFHAWFPATLDPEPPPPPPPPPGAGCGRILVMDDDPMVRRVAGNMLRQLGFQAEFAADGQEAVERFAADPSSWAAVIMDLTVPGGMGGREAIRRFLEIDPEVRALVSSGYSDDPVMADFRSHGFRGVLAKPYTLQELSRALDLMATVPGGAPPEGVEGSAK